MIRETYKGRQLKAVKGKAYGKSRISVNGTECGQWFGTQADVIEWAKRTIDDVDSRPFEGRWAECWYAPGTYELNEHGHVVAPGGICTCSYCEQRRIQPCADIKVDGKCVCDHCMKPYLSDGKKEETVNTQPHDQVEAKAPAYVGCWTCAQPATHTLTRKGSNTLHACDNCTRIDRAEAESRGWTVAPIARTTGSGATTAIDPKTVGELVDETAVVTGDKKLTVSTVLLDPASSSYDTTIFDDSAGREHHEMRLGDDWVIGWGQQMGTREAALDLHREAVHAARSEEPSPLG